MTTTVATTEKPKRSHKRKATALDPGMIVAPDDAKHFKFKKRDVVYVRKWSAGQTAVITERLQYLAGSDGRIRVPHYLAVDLDGKEWRLSQFEIARRPIECY